jgi:hypothetical protein
MMRIEDLTQEEVNLLQTDFGEELEKQASAYVDQVEVDSEEAVKMASACEQMGYEMAEKLAAEMEENYKEEPTAAEKKTEEEKKKEVMDKEASVRAAIMFQNTIAGLEKLGQERYGDKNIYLEEMVKQSGVKEKILGILKAFKGNTISGAKNVGSGAKSYARNINWKRQTQTMAPAAKKMVRKQSREQVLKGLKQLGPAGAVLGTTAVTGAGLNKLRNNR